MILLLGATGYIGQAFAAELRRRGTVFVPLTRKALDYSRFDLLFNYVRTSKPGLIINAAGYTGRPNMDACEVARAETVHANTLLPQTVARVCYLTKTPLGHVSSGCIYSGAKVARAGGLHIERDLNDGELRRLFNAQPDLFHGFDETDEPNFSFRSQPCSFYSGTKALAEEALRVFEEVYLWRPRIVFDEFDHPRNFLSKVQRYPKIHDSVNSLTHRGEFVRTCLDLWERSAPFGTYNITNPGAITGRQIVESIQRTLQPDKQFEFWKNDEEFYHFAAKAPRSNCVLDTTKLLSTGVTMRPVQDAVADSLARWQASAQKQDWEQEILRVPAIK